MSSGTGACLKNESNSSLANFCSRKSVFIPDIKVKATHLTGGRGEVISTVVDHSILTGTLSVPLVNGLGLFHDLSVKLHFYNVSLVFFLLGRPFIRPVVSEPFNIFVGRFSFIQFLDTLPSNMTNNYSTSITVELVDKGKNRVISENQHLIRTDIENPKNNASSAVATIDSLSVHGVAAFRVNASFTLSIIRLRIKAPNVQSIPLLYSDNIAIISIAKSGSFRLKVSLDPIFPALSETYVTQNINWNAAAMAAQENSTSNEPGIGSGESMQSKLQAIPGIGTVHIQRRDLINSRGSQTVRQWYVTYLSFIGDISALILDKTSKLPSNSSVSQRTINDGVAYSLTIGLDFGNGKKSELKTRDFKLEP